MADDAVGLLDHLEIDAAHVAGASMGGMIAQTLAVRHPQRVLSICSIMSTTGNPDVGQARPEALVGAHDPGARPTATATSTSTSRRSRRSARRAFRSTRSSCAGGRRDVRPLGLSGRVQAPARRDHRFGRPHQGARADIGPDGRDPRQRRPADHGLGRRGDGPRDTRREARRDTRAWATTCRRGAWPQIIDAIAANAERAQRRG